MLQRVTWKNCEVKVVGFIDGVLPAEELIEWSRAAMMAAEMPPREQNDIMSLLQDLSVSTPKTLHQAIKHFRVLSSIQRN
jgi:hypothetical protein